MRATFGFACQVGNSCSQGEGCTGERERERDNTSMCVWILEGPEPVYWFVAAAQVFELFCSKLQTSVCIFPFHGLASVGL